MYGVGLFYDDFGNLVALATDEEAVLGIGYSYTLKVEVFYRCIVVGFDILDTYICFIVILDRIYLEFGSVCWLGCIIYTIVTDSASHIILAGFYRSDYKVVAESY